MSEQALMIAGPAAPAPAVTAEQVELIKRTIAQDATEAELQLFFFDCRRHGVHPLDRMIHFTKRDNRYTPITSIDFMRSRAADTGEMAGSDDPEFGGEGEDRFARVVVYRMTQGQRYPYAATARWSEYYPGEGKAGFMWRKMPHTMLGKCAEALALRKAFPKQLQGLYAREEMEQASRGEIVEVRPAADTTPATNGHPAPEADPWEGAQLELPTPAEIAAAFRNGAKTCPVCKKPAILKSKDRPEWFCWAKRGGCGGKFPDLEPGETAKAAVHIGTITKEYVAERDRLLTLAGQISDELQAPDEDRKTWWGTYCPGATRNNVALKPLGELVGYLNLRLDKAKA